MWDMFNRYPYINLTDRNLDLLTKAIRDMQNEVKNFVSINAVKYANPIQWSINRQYEKNTIVIDPLTGTAYISVQPVPSGVSLTRAEYWTVVFDLSQFVTKAASNFANTYERDITTTATMPTGAGDWVVWDSTLYVALNAIHAGDAYVVGGNIKRMTVEDFYDLLMDAIHNLDEELDTEIRNRSNADTTLQHNIDAEASAREFADDALQDNIDAEALARQQADGTLQDNIDAEALASQQADGTLQDNIDAEALARLQADGTLQGNIDELTETVGDLDTLTTTNKSDIVAAINEVNRTGGGAIGKIGDLDDLHTTDKTSVVNSINSLNDSINMIVLNVRDFGAKGDGVTDDYSSIMSAINALPAGGGTVYFPAGNYAISHEITVGDGNAATTANGHPSTRQNIKLRGVGCSRAYTPQVTQITPIGTIGTIINVRGLIDNVEIDGFNLFANGHASYGMFICATNFSTFKNISIYNPTYCGLALVGGKAPTGNYNTACLFKQITVTLNTDTTVGLRLTGDVSANNDSWLTTFEDCRFQSMAGTNNCTSGEFRFCDNITFLRCHFVTYSPTGRGIDLNALDTIANNPFPTGLSFIDCSIASTVITEDPASGRLIGVNRFYGYGITDGEVLPPQDSRLVGFDANCKPFNGFGQSTFTSIAELVAAEQHLPKDCTMTFSSTPPVSNPIFGINGSLGGIMTRRNTAFVELLTFTSGGLFYAQVDNSGNLMTLKHVNFVT